MTQTIRTDLSQKITLSLAKLRLVKDLQKSSQFWYADTILLTHDDITHANNELGSSIGSRYLDLGLHIGESFTTSDEGDTLIQLYRFNESLTRLLSNQKKGQTYYDQEAALDCSMLIRTFINLLMIKLEQIKDVLLLVETGSGSGSSTGTGTENMSSKSNSVLMMESKIVDEILKNISNRVLIPYHTLLLNRAQSHLVNI